MTTNDLARQGRQQAAILLAQARQHGMKYPMPNWQVVSHAVSNAAHDTAQALADGQIQQAQVLAQAYTLLKDRYQRYPGFTD